MNVGEFRGASGFRRALTHVIIPQLEKFQPELLIISAGFDGYQSDPIGKHVCVICANISTSLCLYVHMYI
jgi:acetoin utilization deacetylase AcuC-like enzyme